MFSNFEIIDFNFKLYFSIYRHEKEICHFAIFITIFIKNHSEKIFVRHFIYVSLNTKIDSFESFEEQIKLFTHLKEFSSLKKNVEVFGAFSWENVNLKFFFFK